MKTMGIVYNHLPKTLRETVQMKNANSTCRIYQGDFVIKVESKTIEVNGIIYFAWLGNRFGVNFQSRALSEEFELFQYLVNTRKVQVFINGEFLGDGIWTKAELNRNKLNGKLLGTVTWGDKNKEVNRILFSIPNLLPMHGPYNVVKATSKKVKISSNRIVLKNKGFTITLDLRFDSSNMFDSLKENGGFGIMYSGEIVKDNETIMPEEISEVLSCLSRFLSFINGRKISALFIEGYIDKNLIWKDYTSYKNEPYKAVHSWTPSHWSDYHTEMWIEFSDHFFDKKHKTILSSVINWYIEANGNSGIEVTSVLAQSALELIFNWFYEKEMIKDTNGDVHSSGSTKLRSILEVINYPKDVPNSLIELSDFLDSYKVEKEFNKKTGEEYYPIKDACLIITKIRNALVHSDNKNRKRLARIPTKVLAQSVNLSLVYIEIALLYILRYNGKFKNRCSPTDWNGDEGFVPWIDSK